MSASFLGSIEFYVIAAFVAAAVIAVVSRPSQKSAARTFFYAGVPVEENPTAEATIECVVDERGNMEITRRGLEGITDDGAYSLAVEIIGLDVTIKERLSVGRRGSEPIYAARATLDCLGPERYHFQYLSEATKTGTAFYLTARPGNRVVRELKA